MSSFHITSAPGRGLRCRCGEKAILFVLCLRCRGIVSSCGGHKMTGEQEREAHCSRP